MGPYRAYERRLLACARHRIANEFDSVGPAVGEQLVTVCVEVQERSGPDVKVPTLALA